MHLTLADKTVLVTGGGSGIGKGVATAAVAAGANVMIVGRNADRLAAAAAEITSHAKDSGSVLYEPADVTNEDEVNRVVDAATAWLKRSYGPCSAAPAGIASVAASANPVRMMPGCTITTSIPKALTSNRSASLIASTAYFVAW